MNKIKKHLYYTLPLILWMALIFYMSHQNATTSSETSGQVGMLIGRLLVPGFSGMTESQQILYVEGIQYVVRKSAHVCEYMILGILISRFIYNIKMRFSEKHFPVVAFAIGVLYATIDEIHQLFIPGRSGQVGDIMIDGCGIFIGVVLYKLWNICRKKYKKV